MTGKIMPLRERDTSTVQAAADAFLSSPRYANRTPGAATPVCSTGCSQGSVPAARVNGHWEIRVGGLVMSRLAATRFPG